MPEGSPAGLEDALAARGAEDRLLGAAAAWTVARRAGAIAGPRVEPRAAAQSDQRPLGARRAAADAARGHVPVAAAASGWSSSRSAACGRRPSSSRRCSTTPRAIRRCTPSWARRPARSGAGWPSGAPRWGFVHGAGDDVDGGLGRRRARGAPRAARAAAPHATRPAARELLARDVRRGDLGGPRGVRRHARRTGSPTRTSRCWRPRSTTAASPSATPPPRCSCGCRARASRPGWRRARPRCCASRTTRWSSTLPDTPDAAAVRDGVPAAGRRSERLRSMLAATPLATWVTPRGDAPGGGDAPDGVGAPAGGDGLVGRDAPGGGDAPGGRDARPLAASPRDLVRLPVRDDLADVVHSGWAAAAIAQRDAAWARALWEVRPDPQLLLALPHDEARAHRRGGARARRRRARASPAVGRSSSRRRRSRRSSGGATAGDRGHDVAFAGHRLDPALAPEAEERLRDLGGRDLWVLCDILSTRAAMLRELS